MNKILKILLILTVMFCFAVSGIRAEAAELSEFSIKEEGGEYLLYNYTGIEESLVLRSDDLSEILNSDKLPLSSIIVFCGIFVADDVIIRNKTLTLSGSLSFAEGSFISEDSELYFSSLTLDFSSDGGFRLKSGSLNISDSEITSASTSAISLDYSSNARLNIFSGSLRSSSPQGTVRAELGTVNISGGKIDNSIGAALYSETSVYLSSSPEFSGTSFDIETSSPINLENGNIAFSGSVKIKYASEFSKGTITPVLYKASEASVLCVRLYDKNGEEKELSFFSSSPYTEEKNFGAVYLPYEISFYDGEDLYSKSFALAGEYVTVPEEIQKPGYKFLGWSSDSAANDFFEFESAVKRDISLYSRYELLPPEFSLNSCEFTYSGKENYLEFDYIKHPLLDSGSLSYLWYRGDTCVSSSEKLKAVSVSDSGTYICKLRFTHNGNEVNVETKPVTITVSKAEIALPEIPAKEYTGKLLYPDVFSTALYSVSASSGIDSGKYPVVFTLLDSENYKFSGFSESVVSLDFEIIKAQNEWVSEPSLSDIYVGESLSPSGVSKFGDVKFLFSSSLYGVYEEALPTLAGAYYMRAEVDGCDNYTALISEPLEFYITAEEVVAISVKSPPEKLRYKAFETLELRGIVLLATYNSGRTEEISPERIGVIYPRSDKFLFGDSYLTLSYGGKETVLNVITELAEYDISNISFLSSQTVYDGSLKTISYSGSLPCGEDGIVLSAEVIGAETNAGVYEIKLVFKTESSNYKTPETKTAKLEILPLERPVLWENLEFVYDGKQKAPSAYFIDTFGSKVHLSVSGARSYAGDYSALAEGSDTNYTLTNTSAAFKILKADYDMSGAYWSSSEFVYDGNEKSVLLLGLPYGVSVIGYADNKATNAGSYLAKVSLSYDFLNYNAPVIPDFLWTVRRADYSLEGFSFSSKEAVYDGNTHYPDFVGELPVGADGIALSYRFDKGAVHVSEGKVKITVIFETASRNYNIPSSYDAYVTIKPQGIEVIWDELSFVYSGVYFAPSAVAEESAISVLGAAKNAGEYTAKAVSENSDYYVINASCSFKIERAENSWRESIEISDIYAGDLPAPSAKALAGNISYRYYADSGLQNEIPAPVNAGTYYVIAESDGGENYSAIRSEAREFRVIPLVAVAVSADLTREDLKAYEKLTSEDFVIKVEYNSGKIETVAFEDVIISYQNAETLRVSDEKFTITVFGLSLDVPVSVQKADYDMSGVFWSSGDFIYDAKEKSIFLSGLPEGVSVLSYSGNGAVNHGEYTVTAKLSYDEANFNTPIAPTGTIKIEKCRLANPIIAPLTYTGEYMAIVVENAEFYNYSKILYRDGGRYSVVFELLDSENYIFEETLSDRVEVFFEILPAKITVKIDNMELYLLEKEKEPTYTLDGFLAAGDDLLLKFSFEDAVISCVSLNPNYEISVVEGEIVRLQRLSPAALRLLFIFILLLIIITLLIFALILNRDKFRRIACVMSNQKSDFQEVFIAPVLNEKESESAEILSEETTEEIQIEASEDSSAEREIFSEGIDNIRADELISNAMAKTLVRRAESIETCGNKRRIINIGTLNSAFSEGERVDINRMKSASLIPYDTAYIKVLADGIIDKPLRIYANDFSLSAVKMIALVGGEAVKVNTVKVKIVRNKDE